MALAFFLNFVVAVAMVAGTAVILKQIYRNEAHSELQPTLGEKPDEPERLS